MSDTRPRIELRADSQEQVQEWHAYAERQGRTLSQEIRFLLTKAVREETPQRKKRAR